MWTPSLIKFVWWGTHAKFIWITWGIIIVTGIWDIRSVDVKIFFSRPIIHSRSAISTVLYLLQRLVLIILMLWIIVIIRWLDSTYNVWLNQIVRVICPWTHHHFSFCFWFVFLFLWSLVRITLFSIMIHLV